MYNQNEVTAAVSEYLQKGFAIVPVGYKSKKPIQTGWTSKELSKDELEQLYADRQLNIGVRMGGASGGLVDIDLDVEAAFILAADFLPPTKAIFGRTSKPNSHYLYKCSGVLPKTIKFQEPRSLGGKMLLELRTDGQQTVMPASMHQSGEKITFTKGKDWEPTEIDASTLVRNTRLLAGAVLLALHYPQQGQRNNTIMTVCGVMLNGGYSEQETALLIQGASQFAKDEEWQSRLKSVEGTSKKIAAGEPVTGIRTLAGDLGEEFTRTFCDFLSIQGGRTNYGPGNVDANAEIEKLNTIHAVIMIGGKACILNERKEFDLWGIEGFKTFYANRKVAVPSPSGISEIPLSKHWLTHADRRTYVGLEFNPKVTTPEHYNIFKGYTVRPVEGDCSKYLAHIRDNIAGGNEEHYTWILAWMADIIQSPSDKKGSALVIGGKQGTGKSLFVQQFGNLLGYHYKIISEPQQIVGRFNSYMKDCLLLHSEEAVWAGDKVGREKAKEIITGKTFQLELKGKDIVTMNSYVRMVITGNNPWLVAASGDERRYAVFEISDKQRGNTEYFRDIVKQMENGGAEALLFFLQNFDLSKINLRKIPITSALYEQKIHTLDDEQQWWLDVLQEGRIDGAEWERKNYMSRVQEHYINYTKDAGRTRRSAPVTLGMALSKMVPNLQKKRNRIGRYYLFPELGVCRKFFEGVIGQKIEWTEIDPSEDGEPKLPF